jgi:hypothetical protein
VTTTVSNSQSHAIADCELCSVPLYVFEGVPLTPDNEDNCVLLLNKCTTRSALYWVIKQRIVVVPYRRFGTTYRADLQGSRNLLPWIPPPPSSRVKKSKYFIFLPLKMGPISCPETSVRNYHYTLRSNLEERSYHLLRGGSLKKKRKP